MMGKDKKAALTALDTAHKEYDEICTALRRKYQELDRTTDNAVDLVSKVEVLVGSIRNRPWSYQAKKRKISVIKQKFINSKELKRKERDNNIVAVGVAGLFGGIGLIAFLKDFCKKDIIRWIICIAFLGVIGAIYLVFKAFNGIQTARKAYKQTEIIKEEICKSKILFQKANVQVQKINDTAKAVHGYYSKLGSYARSNYKELPEETQTDLGTMYNLTLALTELINTQIG